MRIERNNSARTLYLEADSVTDMVEHASRWNMQPQASGAPIKWTAGDWIGHRGLRCWADLKRVVQQPWQEGMAACDSLRQKLDGVEFPAPTDRRRRRQFNEEAGEVDIDRVMTGQLDCFSAPVRRPVRQPKTLRLQIPFSFSANIKAEQIMWKAVAAVIITDLLEAAGRPVEISMMCLFDGVYGSRFGSAMIERVGWVATLKAANDPLNLSALVNALSPWFFRTVCFGMMDSQPDLTTYSHRGFPNNDTDNLKQMAEVLGVPDNTECIMVPTIFDADRAEKFIRDTIAKMEAAE